MELAEITKELTKYDTTTAAIAEMSRQYMALEIKGIDDRDGYKLVHTARMEVKSKRVAVKKRGEELREDANKFRTAVIDEVKRITALLEPIESHLEQEEARVDDEVDRLKREDAEKEAKVLQERVNALYALGCREDENNLSYGTIVAPKALLKVCTDDQFSTIVGAITELIEKEQAEKKAEADRLAAIQAEQTKIAQEQAAERARLAQEAKRLQDEADRQAREKKAAEDAILKAEFPFLWLRAAELEKAKAEAAERAKVETEQRLKREAEEKEAKAKADAEEKLRKEEAARIKAERKLARRPDKEKLKAFADIVFQEAVTPGEMKTEEGKIAHDKIMALLGDCHEQIRGIIEAL